MHEPLSFPPVAFVSLTVYTPPVNEGEVFDRDAQEELFPPFHIQK